jgi:hypothetical protein
LRHTVTSKLKTHIAPGESIVSVVAPKVRDTRYTPHLPLPAPEANPKNIINKGKASQGASSFIFSGTAGNLPDSIFQTPVVVSSIYKLPIVEASEDFKIG